MLSGIILSCSNDNDKHISVNPELIGKWKLIETFEDPGDGSGVYESIDSEKTIEFFNNGTFTISGPLCGLSTTIGQNTTGNINYSSEILINDNSLNSNEECEHNTSSKYGFHIENSDLIIYWTACVEGCALKYQKLTVE